MANIAAELKNGAASVWNDVSRAWTDLFTRGKKALGMKLGASRPTPASVAVQPHGALARFKGWAFLPAHVLEDDDAVIVRIDAPGMRREDFTIEVAERSVKVRGVRRAAEHLVATRWHVSQMVYGSFCRYFDLPSRVCSSHVTAVYRAGVLRIEIPKATRTAAISLPVQPL